MTAAEKNDAIYILCGSKYRNWPRLGLGAVGLRSLGLADLGAGLCKRNSVLNVALFLNYQNVSTSADDADHNVTMMSTSQTDRWTNKLPQQYRDLTR